MATGNARVSASTSEANRLDSAQWVRVTKALGLAPSPATGARLIAAYRDPKRHYHNEGHIAACLALLDEVRDQARQPAEIEFALWFHDAVYDTHAADNEAKSADWAASFLAEAGAGAELAARIRSYILATRHDGAPAPGDAALTVDIDLAILGRPPAAFDAFDRAIRQEYAWVPEAVFRSKRAEVLRNFLERPAIYRTPALRQRFEAQARTNLRRALERLSN